MISKKSENDHGAKNIQYYKSNEKIYFQNIIKENCLNCINLSQYNKINKNPYF